MKTVMIVDDQLGIRVLLEEVVKNAGYNVESFDNGTSAIESLDKVGPDLLLIDYRLPLMTGCEVVEKIETKGAQIPVIIMSGVIDEVKEQAKDLQLVKGYLSKPFNIMEAQDLINKILN